MMMRPNPRGYYYSKQTVTAYCSLKMKGISFRDASSSVIDDSNETCYATSFEDFCTLYKAWNNFNLLIHKSLLILRERLALNQ